MQTEEDIRWISSLPYFGTPEAMIHESFDLPMDEVLPYDLSLIHITMQMLEMRFAHIICW